MSEFETEATICVLIGKITKSEMQKIQSQSCRQKPDQFQRVAVDDYSEELIINKAAIPCGPHLPFPPLSLK